MSLPPYFVGRAVELTRIRQAAGSVRAGQPWFVVVQGESGIGKTTLLLWAVSELDDFVVLRAGGVPGRQHEPFAVVRELLTRLPAGLDGPAAAQLPEMAPSVVGGQLLRALVGAERPVAVVVDDVQWVDRESAGALRFLLRQLVNDRVLHIVGYRPVPTGVGGVESVLAEAMRAVGGRQTYLRLSGLAAPESSDLARKVYDTRLSPAAADRIATATGGHPLYVRTLLAEAPTGWVDRLDGRPPMPDSLGMLLRGRVAELPDDTRALLKRWRYSTRGCR